MRFRIPVIAALPFGLLSIVCAVAQEAPRGTEVCHIANAGFAVRAPEGTVLIDALFRDGLPDYQQAPGALNEKMETGAAPFDDVRLVVVTHAHPDHFNAAALVRHAKHNPDTHYLVTPQARKRMIEAGFPEAAGSRVQAVYPHNDRHETRTYGHIRAAGYRVSHGKGSAIQNIGVLIETGGVKVFHTGDMEPYPDELAEAGLRNLGVDAALVPFWVLMSAENRKLVSGTFAAKTVIPMHVPDREQDWMAEYGGLAGLRTLIESNVPEAVWMTGEMECRSLEHFPTR